jgi:hypothetical protein
VALQETSLEVDNQLVSREQSFQGIESVLRVSLPVFSL